MDEVMLRNNRYKAEQSVEKACSQVQAAARHAVRTIRDAHHFTEEYKAERIKETVQGAYDKFTLFVNDARSKTARDKQRSKEKLEELRHVPDETLATRAAIPGPVLSKAADDPDALLNAYLRRAPENTADRRLLEQTAQALLDAGIGGAGFAERWQREQQRVEIPQAERDLIDQMAMLEEIEDFLDSASQVMAADLQEHACGGLDGSASMNREYHRAAVHRFENGTRLEDMTPERVGAAGVYSQGGGR
jgi:hypothetical protein